MKSQHDIKPQRDWVDYSAETKVSSRPLLRYVWLLLGFLFTGLGFLGYILPGLPGTVFILIAVYFFARSSPRFYNWLLNHPWFGELIRDWRGGKGLSFRAKITAMSVIALTMITSYLTIPNIWLKTLALVCAAGVIVYLWTRRTKR
ncbi:MAG: YbaN family protein [Trueperaceae bacterium]